jgi:opacity protein-like surface antigen
MTIRSMLLAVGITAALSLPASAQSSWTSSVSAFGGGSAFPTFGASVTDPSLAASLDVRDRKINVAPVFGGAVGVWHGLGDGRARIGIRGNVSFQPARADAQVNPAAGTLFGMPFAGPLPVPQVDGSVTLVNGEMLVGWESGRVMPYGGAGAGALHVTARQLGASDSSNTPSLTGVGGIAVRLTRRVSTYAEYRYLVAEPTIVIGTQTVVFKVKPSQVVSGLSLTF